MSSSSPPELSTEKDERKRLLEGIGGGDQSKHQKTSSSPPESIVGKVEGKSVQEEVRRGRTSVDPVSGRKICLCGRYSDHDEPPGGCHKSYMTSPGQRFLTAIPGMFVASYNWSFVDEMLAKADDKTLVVSNITFKIQNQADFRKLFEEFGVVEEATLAPVDADRTMFGDFGFVTFANKEDAGRARYELSGPQGEDKTILVLDWASSLKNQN